MQLDAPAPISVHSLTGFDWFLVCLVVISGLMALRKGLILVVFSTLGLAAGLLLGAWYFPEAGAFLHEWITSLQAAEVVGFIAIFVAVSIFFSLVAGFVRKAARVVGLGPMDRLLGGLFGVARGFLLGVGVLTALTAFDPGSELARNSLLSPYFLAGAHAVSLIVPAGERERMQVGAERLMKSPEKVLKPDAKSQ